MTSGQMNGDLVVSEFLWDVVRSTEAYYGDISVSSDGEVFDPRSPALRKLVLQIQFSRRFIVTYYAVLGGLVAVFVAHHWYQKRRRAAVISPRRPPSPGTPSSTSAASSDTTLLESENHSVKDGETERTSLLHKNAVLRDLGATSQPRLLHRLRAFLMYEPKSRPALTAPSNELPSNATTLIILLLLAINLFYLFYHMPLTIPMLFAFADRAGLCFVVNLPILYLLATKSNQPLQLLTGWSYEGLNIIHRRLGEWMIAFAALHGLSMMGVWYTLLRPLHFGLVRFLSSKVILLGIFALVAYMAIYVSSIGWIRRLYYETFLGLHVVLQVAALALLFFHHHGSRPYVIGSFAIWSLDRLLIRMLLSKRKLIATLQLSPDQETVLLFAEISIQSTGIRSRLDLRNGWEHGQHVFVTVPGLGWRHRLQAHPFTVASPAPSPDMVQGSWPLQLTIRAQDGFSKDLVEFSKIHQHCEVWIDGPYGSTEALEAVRSADRTCFIAGGSGIAVTYPLSWACQVSDRTDALVSTRVVYENGVKQGGQAKFKSEAIGPSDSYAHLWVRQDSRAESWISYFPRKSQMLGQSTTTQADTLGQLITSKFETGGIHSLRPDVRTELREWVEDGARKGDKIAVVVSGPEGLVRDVRNAAASLLLRGYDIDVHVEKFGW